MSIHQLDIGPTRHCSRSFCSYRPSASGRRVSHELH